MEYKNKSITTVEEFCASNAIDDGKRSEGLVTPESVERVDVVLGYEDVASYENGSCYYGATIGRYANRINEARFTLDGREYRLEKNSGENHIHGVFAQRIFDAAVENGDLLLRYFSPDLEEGYPGNLTVRIRCHLREDNALELSYEATTDAPTIQLYSGNFVQFDPVPCGKRGVRYPKNGGFCMEAQHYPDSMDHPAFPNTVLRPGETYTQKTVYQFSRQGK